jgi:peptide/nickel transport system permease protein
MVLLGISLVVLGAPILPLADPVAIDPVNRVLPVGSAGHPLGTDRLGRDLLSRLIWGGQLSLLAGVAAAFGAMALGTIIGLLSGYIGGWLDYAVTRLADVGLAFPRLLLAIAIMAILGPSFVSAVFAVTLASVPRNVRLIRGQVLSIKQKPFVEAGRVLGYGHSRIIFSEIMPNVMATVITMVTLDVTLMIIATASLSFLGLGVQPPQADWGSMVSDGRSFLGTAPHLVLVPSTVMALVCLCFSILGDELQKQLDPRRRNL